MYCFDQSTAKKEPSQQMNGPLQSLFQCADRDNSHRTGVQLLTWDRKNCCGAGAEELAPSGTYAGRTADQPHLRDFVEAVWLFSAHTSCVHFGTAKASRITARMECWRVNPFLLIFLTGFLHTVTAVERTLDMAPDAVDDTFSECRDKMMQKVTAPGDLLQKELEASKDFADMWRSHGGTCEKQIYGGRAHHLAVLQAYGNSGDQFRKMFNRLIQTKGCNTTTYKDEFPFKSLHFLLTDALRLLNPGKTCYTVYFGTGKQYTAENGTEVRFGKFIGASIHESLEIEQIVTAEKGTLFNISSCSVVNVENYTCTSEELEQLISPTEVFRVQNIETASTDDVDYKIITLKHSGFLSNHDCYLFPRPAAGSSSPLLSSMVLALMASFLSLYFCTVTE
ncbi:hypothetical protein AOLI_G00193680 [Acnodon oligacanthus]